MGEKATKKIEDPSKEGSIFNRSELEGGLNKSTEVVEGVAATVSTEGTITTIS